MPKRNPKTGRLMAPNDPNTDPWYAVDRRFLTRIEDLGILALTGESPWEGEEEFDTVSPLRPVVNGRRDYSPPTPTYHYLPREIDQQEVYDRDLISTADIATKAGIQQWRVEGWTHLSDWPLIQGYLTMIQRFGRDAGKERTLYYYDRIDVYDWLESHDKRWVVARMT